MSRVIGYTPVFGPGCFSLSNFSGLVVPGGVDGAFANDLSGGGVADGDVGVVDEHQDVFAGVGTAYADVVKPARMAEVSFPELVHAVDAPAPVVSLFRSGRVLLSGWRCRRRLVFFCPGHGGGVRGCRCAGTCSAVR